MKTKIASAVGSIIAMFAVVVFGAGCVGNGDRFAQRNFKDTITGTVFTKEVTETEKSPDGLRTKETITFTQTEAAAIKELTALQMKESRKAYIPTHAPSSGVLGLVSGPSYINNTPYYGNGWYDNGPGGVNVHSRGVVVNRGGPVDNGLGGHNISTSRGNNVPSGGYDNSSGGVNTVYTTR